MPVRSSYTLRTPLDSSIADTPINITSSSGTFHLKREITVRTLLTFALAVLLFYFLTTHQPLEHGGLIGTAVFFLGYFMFTCLIVMPTKTQLPGYHLLKPMYQYWMGTNRWVHTRAVSKPGPVSKLLGISKITRDDGTKTGNSLIIFNNGDLGEIMDFSGNASILTFASDRKDILANADKFYREVKPQVSILFDSVSSAQRTVKQVRNKDKQLKWMRFRDPHLINMVLYQKYVLQDFVGHRFKAWHQYAIIRGVDKAALNQFNSWLYSCAGGDSAYVRHYRKLSYDEMKRYLATLYGDDVSNMASEK